MPTILHRIHTPTEYEELRGPYHLELEQVGAGEDLAFKNVLVFTGSRRPPELLGTDWVPRAKPRRSR